MSAVLRLSLTYKEISGGPRHRNHCSPLEEWVQRLLGFAVSQKRGLRDHLGASRLIGNAKGCLVLQALEMRSRQVQNTISFGLRSALSILRLSS